MTRLITTACLAALAAFQTGIALAQSDAGAPKAVKPDQVFATEAVATFNQPWAMAFLPDGQLLVTERAGRLKLVNTDGGAATEVEGTPDVLHAGQGGLGDVVLHPDFADNQWVYISYAERGDNSNAGAAVARARLVQEQGKARLDDLQVIWRQHPFVGGRNHYGHRLAFGTDGKLWVTSGERQLFSPAQDMQSSLGKVLRLNDDGSPASDNPFADQGEVAGQVWSLGHRNPLGIAFDTGDRLWVVEMGPEGGDELNLIARGANYGYPEVSNGDHYDGRPIPDHSTRPEFAAPAVSWNPAISPSSLIVYNGSDFPQWQGSAFIGGLSSKALVRVALDGESAREAERFDMGERIRAVQQGPEGGLWLLEDGNSGRLLKLSPLSDSPAPAA